MSPNPGLLSAAYRDMLRISKKADYAVFLLGAIAREGAYPGGNAADRVVSAQEIASQAGLNKSVVANLLKEFARDGLLESVRGLRGGYRLTQAPADVTLGRILEVVEGPFVLVDCVGHGDAGQHGAARNGNRRIDQQGDDLLPLAPSMKATPAAKSPPPGDRAEARSKPADEPGADCALISFCPSKQPMRVVHERIQQLFAEIRLDELCAMATGCSESAGRTFTSPQ